MANDWETEGKKKKLEGKVQEFTSEMVGDNSGAMKGKAKQALGNIQESLGQIGHKVEREAQERSPERKPRIEPDRP